jgi:hypothetical protein
MINVKGTWRPEDLKDVPEDRALVLPLWEVPVRVQVPFRRLMILVGLFGLSRQNLLHAFSRRHVYLLVRGNETQSGFIQKRESVCVTTEAHSTHLCNNVKAIIIQFRLILCRNRASQNIMAY